MSQIVGATHPGNRDHNEDCFVADASLGLGLVADGMGGYACGEVASELVRATVTEAISNSEGLRDAIVRAHAVVRQEATNDVAKKGMGSTVIAFRIQGQDYELAWVGDSRAYLWDSATTTLHQITRDHSYVETLLSAGAISQDEAINHPNRNLITQAVGVPGGDGLEIELISGRLGEYQNLMICSDGLVDEVVDEEIAEILSSAGNLNDAVNGLVQRAVANGGRDNVSVVMASCSEARETSIDPEFVRSTSAVSPAPASGHAGPASEASGTGQNPATWRRWDWEYFVALKEKIKTLGLDPAMVGGGAVLVLVILLAAVLL